MLSVPPTGRGWRPTRRQGWALVLLGLAVVTAFAMGLSTLGNGVVECGAPACGMAVFPGDVVATSLSVTMLSIGTFVAVALVLLLIDWRGSARSPT